MEINKAYRFELDPNNKVITLFRKHAGTARFAYNWSLTRQIERFNTQEGKNKFTNAISEQKELVKLKDTEFSWMYEVSKSAPQEAIRDLEKAFKNFWKRRKNGVGFPKLKKKGRSKDSFRLYGHIKLSGRYIKLPKIGTVRIKEKIFGKVKGKILSVTVSRQADKWFVSISTVQEVEDPKPTDLPTIGVDLGIATFATLSDGEKIQSPKPLEKSLKKLKRAQKAHSRKKKGSKNRKKSALKIARIYARIANIRKNHINNFTTMLAKTKSIIVIEDLNVKGMSQNHKLSRSILDQGFGETRRQLTYKTGWYGSILAIANMWYPSSKLCSGCNYRMDTLPLAIREWQCPNCGITHDRDINAAVNLVKLLDTEQYLECQGNCGMNDINIIHPRKPVEIPLAAELDLRRSKSTSYVSGKQEVNIIGESIL